VLTAPFAGSNPALTAKPDFVLKSTELQLRNRSYNEVVTDSLKVPKEQFEAVMRALLSTPPMPASDIPPKREPKTKKQATKKPSRA
jgi:hypothetical protein